ncbi:iron-containing alcohol dehydrogenase [Telmatocola sphagniphila]|uniref:Iron-containing alcohol dehydrogenase n=1 Tax=Telmatocola sphagniphila TaxID=1123043 RepID=A0A8E6B8A6_9BACT|nr:iron-containing alcohol dehydrogenase [Telmatocola sphagniphila]QVL33717.1 iron-containing alcohol dehydrogenase [Telmatocola sphagniphila]
MRTVWNFASSKTLYFGKESNRLLAELLLRQNIRRVLVITDPVMVKTGLFEPIQKDLSAKSIAVEIFPDGEPEPSLAVIRKAASMATTTKPEAILGFGGGSNMDAAKLVAILHAHGGDPRDYTGEFKVPGPVTKLICIPTTAGTGSEVSQAAVFTDTEIQLKVSTLSPYLRPDIAIVDPSLTMTCPKKVTADSGIDALTHAVEAYTAIDNATYDVPQGEPSVYQGKNFLADTFAEKCIRLCGQYLKRAVNDGSDYEAREGMALAATLGGLAFSNAGVALVHAMEYPVGAATHCSHGAGNGLLLPYIMKYNSKVRMTALREIAEFLGESTAELSEKEAAQAAIAAVENLRESIGVPGKLTQLGVKPEQLAGFASKAFSIKRLMKVNPVYPTEADILGIYREAL